MLPGTHRCLAHSRDTPDHMRHSLLDTKILTGEINDCQETENNDSKQICGGLVRRQLLWTPTRTQEHLIKKVWMVPKHPLCFRVLHVIKKGWCQRPPTKTKTTEMNINYTCILKDWKTKNTFMIFFYFEWEKVQSFGKFTGAEKFICWCCQVSEAF